MSAFYGTVEQQGQLTLHLHMLIWIHGTLSPDEMRCRILDPTSDFREHLVNYLEGTHAGNFINASLKDIESDMREISASEDHKDPTEMLPKAPPLPCSKEQCNTCDWCTNMHYWWMHFGYVVNALLFKSNLHKCLSTKNKDGSQNKGCVFKGCLDNIYGKCKARFPHTVYKKTEIDPESGSILMKKIKPCVKAPKALIVRLVLS